MYEKRSLFEMDEVWLIDSWINNRIPMFDEICERILEAAREIVEDVYAENAKNYTGLDTKPIPGMKVAHDKSNIFTYRNPDPKNYVESTRYTLSIGGWRVRMSHSV